MTKQLDRALWLLVHRSDLWAHLDGDTHDLLAESASPYDTFFGCLERSFHDHGAMGREALLAELSVQAKQLGAETIVSRVAALHDPEPDTDLAAELDKVFDRLRVEDLDDSLKLIVESGDMSPEMKTRYRELDAKRSHLKALLAKAPEPSAR